jgi:hypothetical protein
MSLLAQQAVTLYKAVFDTGYSDRKEKRSSNLDSGIDCGEVSGLSTSPTTVPVSTKFGSGSAIRFVPVEILLTTNKVNKWNLKELAF